LLVQVPAASSLHCWCFFAVHNRSHSEKKNEKNANSNENMMKITAFLKHGVSIRIQNVINKHIKLNIIIDLFAVQYDESREANERASRKKNSGKLLINYIFKPILKEMRTKKQHFSFQVSVFKCM
jgi:hypothetical protein